MNWADFWLFCFPNPHACLTFIPSLSSHSPPLNIPLFQQRVATASPRMCCYTRVGWTSVFTPFLNTISLGLKTVLTNEQGCCHFIKCKMLGMFKSNSNQSNREQEIGEAFIPLETALFSLHFYRSREVFCLLWHQKQLFQTSGIFLPFTRAAYTGCESKKIDFSFRTLYRCFQQDRVPSTILSWLRHAAEEIDNFTTLQWFGIFAFQLIPASFHLNTSKQLRNVDQVKMNVYVKR